MKARNTLSWLIALSLSTAACTTKKDSPASPADLVETPAAQAEAELAISPPPLVEPKPAFAERELEGAPFKEENLVVRVFWNADTATLNPCDEPSKEALCKSNGPSIERGQELSWTYSLVRVKPRILRAKHDLQYRIHGADKSFAAGTELGLYLYQGEGSCAVELAGLYDEFTSCPSPEDFENYPDGEGEKARQLAPSEYDWWVQSEQGWYRIDRERMRIELESGS
ncbi:MAG: hypothetical protein H0U74_10205 [Bradymonadaceae bacterium]|nr:hypothetical protein [Lujinxingiaceae bacterium]